MCRALNLLFFDKHSARGYKMTRILHSILWSHCFCIVTCELLASICRVCLFIPCTLMGFVNCLEKQNVVPVLSLGLRRPFPLPHLTTGTLRRCHENKPKLACGMIGDTWPSCPFTTANRELSTRDVREAILDWASYSHSTIWLAVEYNHKAQSCTEESPGWAQLHCWPTKS